MGGRRQRPPHNKRNSAVRIAGVLLVLGLVLPADAQHLGAGRHEDFSKSLAPYVPSPKLIVNKMLDVSRIQPGETLYDLGCGDGRILIAAVEEKKAKAVGVELSPRLASQARENIERRNLGEAARVIEGNALEVDVSPADVVTLYLLTSSNDKLRPILERQLKPGARVVSHDFEVRGWAPSKVEKVEAHGRVHTIYLYEMPPKR
ncbi:MAG: class I SAM-dependent methyltransferase [Bryobacteraceae bacterium]|nr:class I SAM-dependent methyltransferase [Bryobacteraceae bacterium]